MPWAIDPTDPTGPKKALQLPSATVGPGPGHCTPVNPVLPSCTQPLKLPVSKPPLTTRFSACAGAAIASPIAVITAPRNRRPCVPTSDRSELRFAFIVILLFGHTRKSPKRKGSSKNHAGEEISYTKQWVNLGRRRRDAI